ncbi:unnamed protein product, partial [marine sediment metagenome]
MDAGDTGANKHVKDTPDIAIGMLQTGNTVAFALINCGLQGTYGEPFYMFWGYHGADGGGNVTGNPDNIGTHLDT